MDNPISACIDRNPFSSVDELVAAVSDAGMAAVEWFEAGADRPWSKPHAADHLRILVRRYGLTAQYHAPYEPPYDLACEGGTPRHPGDVAGLIHGFLDRAERLGARMITLHLGTNPKDMDRSEALRRVMEGILLALPQVERRHMRLALENHTGAIIESPLGDRPEDFDWLMENVQSEWVGRTLDLGHAHINGHLDEFLARPFDRIFNVHLHDNNGRQDDHLPMGRGTVPWESVLGRVSKECYRGPLTLEFFGQAEDYAKAIEIIRRCN